MKNRLLFCFSLCATFAFAQNQRVKGWIVKFFPFDKNGNQRELSEISTSGSLASEIVKVPFVLEENETGSTIKMEIRGGFIGLTQDRSV